MDLEKACPKDPNPLPNLNRTIDTTVGHELLSFMDAFSGYNQIKIHRVDEKKTTLVIY